MRKVTHLLNVTASNGFGFCLVKLEYLCYNTPWAGAPSPVLFYNTWHVTRGT